MKQIITLISFLFFSTVVFSQKTIEYCQQKARAHYPKFSNIGILEKTAEYSISNANKSYLPQLNLSAKATYQSDVTAIDLKTPLPIEVDFPRMSKDQYQAVLEMSQLIWDGGYTNNKKEETKAELESQKAGFEVELYTLRDRIANLYFGILSIKEQKAQAYLMEKELERNLKQVEAYVEGGLANESDLDFVRVEQLNIKQRIVEIELLEKSYIKVLSIMIGEELRNETKFEEPKLSQKNLSSQIQRPELRAFESQINLLDTKKKIINTQSMPQFAAFAQGGYGKPALNMFNENPDFFAIIGLRMSWNISSFYTKLNKRLTLESNKQLIESNKEAFLFNTNLQLESQKTEVERLEKLLQSDKDIIQIRERIKQAAEYKLENGTMSVGDYLKEVNSSDIAKQNSIVHRIQLLMSIYKHKNLTNQSYEK